NGVAEKENILARIGEALILPAPGPGHGHGVERGRDDLGTGETPAPTQHARRWLPRVGDTFEEKLALFQKNAADLKADFRQVKGLAELGTALGELRDAEGWKKFGTHTGDLTNPACETLALP